MKHRRTKTPKYAGFTVIEVLIALAIVGILLALLLIVIAGANRHARNYDRKHTLETVAASIEDYRATYGQMPPSEAAWMAFIEESLRDVTTRYPIVWRGVNTSHGYRPPMDSISIQYGHWCNRYGDGTLPTDAIAGDAHNWAEKYVVWTLLEPSEPGNGNIYCLDNNGR